MWGRGTGAAGIISHVCENVLRTASAMQKRCDRHMSRLMTSVLAVALAVSTLGAPLPALAANAHACCTRMAGHCPSASMPCCAVGQRDRAPEPLPMPRATTPAPDLDRPLAAAMLSLRPLPATAPVYCLKRPFAPLALYLLNSALLV